MMGKGNYTMNAAFRIALKEASMAQATRRTACVQPGNCHAIHRIDREHLT